MVTATQWITAVFYVFLSAVMSEQPSMEDDTWMAMVEPEERPDISWCASVIVSSNWVLSDQECAISEALGLWAVAGVRTWADRELGQQRKGDAVLRTPFSMLRGVHLVQGFDFNDNVSFVRLAQDQLPVYGAPCRASGASHAPAAEDPAHPRRLVSETVLAMPSSLCEAFGLASTQTCARSYPHHFPCGARPPVWLVCHNLLVGWTFFLRPCSDAYQTHSGFAIYPTIEWLQGKIPDLPEPGQLGQSPPGARNSPLLWLLGALPCLLSPVSSTG